MKNSEQIDIWMSRLGQRKSQRLRTDLVAEINAAIQDLESQPFVPWFLQKTATLSVATGDSFKDLPSDFFIEREGTRPYYVLEGTTYFMRKMISGAIFGFTTTSTRPIRYSLTGNEFHFRPVADQAYSILVPYYGKTGGGVLDDSNEVSNLWILNATEWIANKALKVTARTHAQNQPLAADFAALEIQAKNNLYRLHEAREHVNQEYEMGGVSDGS